jgi:hypothetical protein
MENSGGKIKLVWRHPNERVYRNIPPILSAKDHAGKTHFSQPQKIEIKKGIKAWVYELEMFHAQRLLSSQSDRYYLLSPEELIVPVTKGMAFENVLFESVLKDKDSPGLRPQQDISEPVKENDKAKGEEKRPGKQEPGAVLDDSSPHNSGKDPAAKRDTVRTFLNPTTRPPVDE